MRIPVHREHSFHFNVNLDVLACPRCGGRLRLLGTIEDPAAIRAILDRLAVSVERLERATLSTQA